jgi:hypothetical protein
LVCCFTIGNVKGDAYEKKSSPAEPAAHRTPQRAKVDAYDVARSEVKQRNDENALHDNEEFGDFLESETHHEAADRAKPKLINNRRHYLTQVSTVRLL